MNQYDAAVLAREILFSLEKGEIQEEHIESFGNAFVEWFIEHMFIITDALESDDQKKNKWALKALSRMFGEDTELSLLLDPHVIERMKDKKLPPDLLIKTLALKESYERAKIVN